MSRRTPLAVLLALALVLVGACGGDDDGDDAADDTTTTTTEATTTTSQPAGTDEEEPSATTSEPSQTSAPATDADPPSTDTTVPPSAPDEPSGPPPACLSRQVAIAIVQGQSVPFADATVSDLSCYDDWAVGGLVVDGAPAGFAYFRNVRGDWALGYATDSLDDGCTYAVDQGAPAPVLADCP